MPKEFGGGREFLEKNAKSKGFRQNQKKKNLNTYIKINIIKWDELNQQQ